MAVRYKQKCWICKKNYVVTTWKEKFPVCYECEKKQMEGEIKDSEMKKMFDIPEQFYQENAFLRDIKKKYLRYGKLSEKQVEAFQRVVKDLKEPKEQKSKKKKKSKGKK